VAKSLLAGYRNRPVSAPQAGSTVPAACDTELHVALGDILNEKIYFNPFPGKIQIQRGSNLENCEEFIYADARYVF